MSDIIQIVHGPVGVVIRGPLVSFTFKDLQSPNWPAVRDSLVANATKLINQDIDKAINMLEANV